MKKPTCTWGNHAVVGCAIVSLVHARRTGDRQGSPDSMAATADEIAIRRSCQG